MVLLLINNGADVNVVNKVNNTPLRLAIQSGDSSKFSWQMKKNT